MQHGRYFPDTTLPSTLSKVQGAITPCPPHSLSPLSLSAPLSPSTNSPPPPLSPLHPHHPPPSLPSPHHLSSHPAPPDSILSLAMSTPSFQSFARPETCKRAAALRRTYAWIAGNEGESVLAGDDRCEGIPEDEEAEEEAEEGVRMDVNVRAFKSGVEPRTADRG